MGNRLTFFVPGRPVPQPRPRFGKGHTYEAASTHAIHGWKNAVMWAIKEVRGAREMNAPMRVDLLFVFPAPKAFPGRIFMTARPDCDNLAKAILDCLTKMRVFKDDSQVCDLRVRKQYGVAGVHVTVETMGG